jgi:hypothetical protein
MEASIVYHHLTGHIVMRPPICKSVLQELTDRLTGRPVAICRELPDASKEEQALDLRRLVTGDEFWFYRELSPDQMCACSPDEVPECVHQTIAL